MLLGSDNGRAMADAVKARLPQEGCLDLVAGTDLHGTRRAMRAAGVVLAADGGLMHLALTTPAPVVALFDAAIDPAWRLPPAFRGAVLRAGRRDVNAIEPAQVATEALALLGRGGPAVSGARAERPGQRGQERGSDAGRRQARQLVVGVQRHHAALGAQEVHGVDLREERQARRADADGDMHEAAVDAEEGTAGGKLPRRRVETAGVDARHAACRVRALQRSPCCSRAGRPCPSSLNSGAGSAAASRRRGHPPRPASAGTSCA